MTLGFLQRFNYFDHRHEITQHIEAIGLFAFHTVKENEIDSANTIITRICNARRMFRRPDMLEVR